MGALGVQMVQGVCRVWGVGLGIRDLGGCRLQAESCTTSCYTARMSRKEIRAVMTTRGARFPPATVVCTVLQCHTCGVS